MNKQSIYNQHTYRLGKLWAYVRHYVNTYLNHLFNDTVRKQLKNPKSIPIIIISFNQLEYLKRLVDFLIKHGYQTIVIMDNHSTYPPLLKYFEELDPNVTIHRLNENAGHLSFWQQDGLVQRYTKGYYVVTDPDVVPLEACPHDFLNTFRKLLDRAYLRTKVGFSLKLDDLPETNPNKAAILKWESQFWKTKIHPLAYKAELDTTFALYRPGYTYLLKNFTKAWRTDYPLQARHGGWYLDVNNLTEEQRYYMKTANVSASWQINTNGQLINSIHKPLYSDES